MTSSALLCSISLALIVHRSFYRVSYADHPPFDWKKSLYANSLCRTSYIYNPVSIYSIMYKPRREDPISWRQ
ncbi:hypothetical protein PITC_062440 [Penicillium italicum]|uniref:Secreted protein n=1 Tax=Penicillium italicum TaxID=40296 RepID=A0A0A2L4C3_PENIT|nr:hypothetical protein PITC_062440 [Penicillium italicum]